MAIAFRSIGTRSKVDTSATPGAVAVALPAGHVSGDFLIMFVTTDDNTNTTADPSGWTRLFYITNGTSLKTPYTPRLRTKCYYRIDNGSLGASVSLTFDTTSAWPAGKPEVLAFVIAYTGVDATGPVEKWDFTSTTSTPAAMAHPQLTTSVANDWLITFRACSTDSPGATYTNSVGTDAERQDDIDTIPELSCATYDSNAALTAGLQTQRTTTASRLATYGGLAASIALKPASAANAAIAIAGTAAATALAYRATVTTVNGPWALCSSVPDYRFGIDWNQSGELVLPGTQLNLNPYVRTDLSDWTATSASMLRDTTTFSYETLKMTSTAGSSPRVESNQRPVVAGQTYRATGWIYAPSLLPTTSELNINWFDAAHAYLSTGSNTATITPGQWVYFDRTFTAPASAAFADVLMSMGGTPGAGLVQFGYGLLLVDPSTSLTQTTLSLGPGDDVTDDIVSQTTVTYGRDQERQLSPGSIGNAAFSVNNSSRRYSPENTVSPLYGNLDPARPAVFRVSWSGINYPLFVGRVDDFNIKVDRGDRTVDFTFLDGLALLQGVKLSTGVYRSLRTGDVVNTILDLAGWTGGRDVDKGATIINFWWAEGIDALTAIQDLVKSEGPPAIAYVGPDGTFIFRDRHHRLQRAQSSSVQATFTASAVDCTASPPPSGFNFTKPFTYVHGWRDIVNSVVFDVSERAVDALPTPVWTSENTYSLGIGESLEISVSGSDPFINAITPVSGTDYTTSGAGVPVFTLDRTSGASVKITAIAVGGGVVLTGLQLRAQAIPVVRSVKITKEDTGSISAHGEKTYPDQAPWANANDATAIANMILLHYANRRPTVQMRIVTEDPSHFVQVLSRTISDRIHIKNDEMGLDDDFFIERVTHTISRRNMTGRAPVHAVVLGCEKQLDTSANPFRFDVRGSGFDQGVFDPIQSDDSTTVFTFDHPSQGQFDLGIFGT